MRKRRSRQVCEIFLFLAACCGLVVPAEASRGNISPAPTRAKAERLRSLEDDKRAAAEKLMAEADGLRKKNTAETNKEATAKYLEALKLWRELADEAKQAATLTALFEIAYATGRLKEGMGHAGEALAIYRKLGDRAMEAETLNNLAGAHDGLGDTREGIALIEQAVKILQEIGDKKRLAISLNGLGMFYSNIGEIQPAFDALNRSLELRRQTGDRGGEARTLINLGTLLDETGEKRRAAEHYEQGLLIAREVKDARTESAALNNIGYASHHIGEFQRSLDAYAEALELRRSTGNKQGEATTLNNIGTVHRSLGENEEALRLLLQALEIYRAGGFKRNEARTHSSLGAIYRELGELQKGREHYQLALEMQRSLGNKEGEASVLKNIGVMHLSDGEAGKALEAFGESLRISTELGDRETEADTLAALGRAHDQVGDAEKAEASFRRALDLQSEMGTKGDLAETLYYFARLENRLGRRDSAIEKMQQALHLLEEMRSRLTNHQFRTSFYADQQDFFEFYISLLVARHRAEPEKGHDAAALSASEQLRARSLLDSLGEARTDLTAGVPPELLERERIVRQTINAKESQRLAAVRRGDSVSAGKFESEIADLFRRQRDVHASIRSRSPRFAALTETPPLTLGDIRRMLDRDTVLMEYFLGKEKSYLFLVTDRSLDVVELPNRSEIEMIARALVTDLRARSPENAREIPSDREGRIHTADVNWKKSNQRLSEILLAPVAAKIQGKRLVVVGAGILQYISFAALYDPRAAAGRYLVESNEIAYLPSASVLPLLRRTRAERKSGARNVAAVLADPVFSADDPRVKAFARSNPAAAAAKTSAAEAKLRSPQLPRQRSGFSRLRFSRQEADAISGLVAGGAKFVATDFSANLESASTEDLANARIVHFATHGIVNSEFPELSSLVLSLVDESGSHRDGFLRLHDVYNLKLNADLVVLSACETALGKDIKGEGIVGLTRGFMHAGAPKVVASLWKVDDRATATLMKDFYRKVLLGNQAPAAALRSAQIAMIKNGAHANPYYWAAFMVQGDWR